MLITSVHYYGMESVYFYILVKIVKYQVFWRCQVSMCMLSCFSHARLFATLWTLARQAPLSMGFSRQECQRGIAPLQWGLPDPGIQPESLNSPGQAGEFFTTSTSWEALTSVYPISLLICPVVLSVVENEGLKTPTATVELSVSSFSSVGFPSCILGLCYHEPEGLQLVSLQWIDPFIIINWHAC